jgi:hypothetical protein
MLNVIMLSIFLLSVAFYLLLYSECHMQIVVMLNVVMLSVGAP